MASGRRITIVNGFADTNLGGAAITLAAGDLVERIDAEASRAMVAVNAGSPFPFTSATQEDLEILDPPFTMVGAGRLGRLWALARSAAYLLVPSLAPRTGTFEVLRRSQVVVAKGGYVFRERSNIGNLVAGWVTMWPYLFAKRCGAVAVAYSASIGPFRTAPSRALSRFALAGSVVVCPRDEESSRRLTQELHHRGRSRRMPDCVFGLASDRRLVPAPPASRGRRTLAVVPRGGSEPYWSGVVATCRAAIEHGGFEDVIVVLQSGEDRAAGVALSEALGLDPGEIVDGLPDQAIAAYQRAELVLTCRLHGAIFSALAGCPMVMVEHHTEVGKSAPVLADLQVPWAVVTTDGPRSELEAVIDRALDPATRTHLEVQVAELAGEVRVAVDEVVSAVRAATA